jgi:hypothetical protein
MLALTAGLGLPPLSVLHADDETDSKASENKTTKAEVPYRLTGTNHLMVRAKINGKGPFNLIVDTGAPAVFITKKVAKKAKTDIDEKEWAKFDSFELEGGLKIDKVRARVEDLVQIEGMNSMGLAGAELHGVIGYQLLSRFRIEYDLTTDKLVFEPLKFTPPELLPLGKKGADDIQSMGPMVKMMAALLGLKPNFDVVPRGFTGIEFADKDGKVTITRVLAESPAAKAGLKVGDVVTSVKTVSIDSEKDLTRALEKAGIGTKWRFYIARDGKEQEVVVVLGKGL